MKRLLILSIAAAIIIFQAGCSQKTNVADDRKWQLIWSDEFDYTGLPDSSKWGYNTGGTGWGNNEKQYYTERRTENASVGNGILSISAIREDFQGAAYTSARLVTKNKGDWKYGRVEVRAKLPVGRGLWPAIWMLPTGSLYGGWPTDGEIDIMEHVGYLKDSIFGTVHTGAYNHVMGTQKGTSIFSKDVAREFHTYSLEWDENKIDIYFDKERYFTFGNERKTEKEWPFDQPFYLLLNVAVGGNWGGKEGIDETVFPQTMQVDYVRVYQKK